MTGLRKVGLTLGIQIMWFDGTNNHLIAGTKFQISV